MLWILRSILITVRVFLVYTRIRAGPDAILNKKICCFCMCSGPSFVLHIHHLDFGGGTLSKERNDRGTFGTASKKSFANFSKSILNHVREECLRELDWD